MLSIMYEIDPYLLLPLCVLYEIQNQIFQHLAHAQGLPSALQLTWNAQMQHTK